MSLAYHRYMFLLYCFLLVRVLHMVSYLYFLNKNLWINLFFAVESDYEIYHITKNSIMIHNSSD